jgi:hypothetical protein
MNHRLNPIDRPAHNGGVGDISLDDLDAVRPFQAGVIHGRKIEHAHLTPILPQP